MAERNSNRWLQPRRVAVLAMNTFTQLVRMKVFYFLMIFAFIAMASQFFDLPQYNGPEAVGTGELQLLKGWCIGVMKLYSIVFAITATALLLPKDVEDRTLYTILAKPVPRIDYLVGKLAGVLLLVFVSLLFMDCIMSLLLELRTRHVMASQLDFATSRGWTEEALQSLRTDISAQGLTWSLQGGVLAVFLQSAVIGASSLFLSTFSTSTLFTTVVSFLVYVVGSFQADAAEYYRATADAGTTTLASLMMKFLSLVFPNYQLFNVTDVVIQGQVVGFNAIGSLAGLSLFYVVLYTSLSWIVFSDKEF